MRFFFTFYTSCKVLLSSIKLNFLFGFNPFSQAYDILPDQRSGASSRKARLIKSISSSFGNTISSIRTIKVESIPPENNTAILGGSSYTFLYGLFESYLDIPLILLVISFMLSMSSFFTLAMISSYDCTNFGIFLRLQW